MEEFKKPIEIKSGKDAVFKMTFIGREPMKVQWYHEGEELLEDTNIKIEKSSEHTRLLLTKCKRKCSGEIKIKIKNECGTTEAITHLVVLGMCHFTIHFLLQLLLHSGLQGCSSL